MTLCVECGYSSYVTHLYKLFDNFKHKGPISGFGPERHLRVLLFRESLHVILRALSEPRLIICTPRQPVKWHLLLYRGRSFGMHRLIGQSAVDFLVMQRTPRRVPLRQNWPQNG